MKKDDDDDKTVEDYHSFIAQMHGRWGELIEHGKLEVNDPSSVLLPIYFEGHAMGFYMKFDEPNKLPYLLIINNAPPDSVANTLAD